MKQKNLNLINEKNIKNNDIIERLADRLLYVFTNPTMIIILMGAVILTIVVNSFKVIESVKFNENIHLNVLALVFAVIDLVILLFLIKKKNS